MCEEFFIGDLVTYRGDNKTNFSLGVIYKIRKLDRIKRYKIFWIKVPNFYSTPYWRNYFFSREFLEYANVVYR